jgi:hypothetical protein
MCTDTSAALMRDSSKMITLGRSAPALGKAQIQIYSPAGESLLVFSVDLPYVQEELPSTNFSLNSGTKAKSYGLAGL